MLIGYYGNVISKSLRESLSCTRVVASNARKTLWMLKPIFHINDVIKTLTNKQWSCMTILEQFDCFEAFMWFLYYIFENLIFLSRLKIKYYYEDNFDFPCNLTWFIGDAVFMITSTFRLCADLIEYRSHTIEHESCNQDEVYLQQLKRDIVDKSMAFIIVSVQSYYNYIHM